ncbi:MULTISPECIES: LCP family protein [unclassified Arthrobacter]|uniref:LCP family protein n=1 Tax=Micrococcaceae TaxID=1268 RepID=UPI000CFB2F54|nr:MULTISPECIES: LCP family protein [unclassified Arthrobacter]PQZ83947.1 transcriptional regulator [Arthrobacter sp. MYb222]TDU29698.1 LytR family transcriptional attenuator [Arthrobacter sp. JUb115]
MSFEEHPARPRKKKKRTGRAIVLSVLALVMVAALVAAGYLWNLGRTFDSESQTITDAFPAEETRPEVNDESKDAVNILLLGSDTRATREADEDSEDFGTLPNGGRSDTMMLVHIPADRENVFVTSVMRDTWLDIPGVGTAKINRAFASGGVPKAVETLEGLFGVRINHVASVDFEGFKGLTDAVGGVTVNNPRGFKQSIVNGMYFPEGVQTLDGEQALAFVRERKSFPGSDYERVKNQQLFVKALLGQLMSKETLTNPGKVSEVVSQIAPFIAVDETLDSGKVASYASSMLNLRSNDMEFFTLPNKGPGRSADGQSIVIPDMEVIEKFGKALQEDKMAEFVENTDLSR